MCEFDCSLIIVAIPFWLIEDASSVLLMQSHTHSKAEVCEKKFIEGNFLRCHTHTGFESFEEEGLLTMP